MNEEEYTNRSIGDKLKEMGAEKVVPQEPQGKRVQEPIGDKLKEMGAEKPSPQGSPAPAGNEAPVPAEDEAPVPAEDETDSSGVGFSESKVKNSLIVSIGEAKINVEDTEIENSIVFAVDTGGWGINLYAVSEEEGWIRKSGAAAKETFPNLPLDTSRLVKEILAKTRETGKSMLQGGILPSLQIGGLSRRDKNAEAKIELFALTYQLYMQLLTIEFYQRDGAFFRGEFQEKFDRKYGELCLADKTLLELCQNDTNTLTAIKLHLKRDMPLAGTPVFALSAPSKRGDKESVDFKVARRLKEELDRKGIYCFWWENFNSLPDVRVKTVSKWDRSRRDMRYAPKLGFGFAYSSVMIGIALARDDDQLLYETSDNCKGELALYKKLLYNHKVPGTDRPFSEYYVTHMGDTDGSSTGPKAGSAAGKRDEKERKKLIDRLKAALPKSRQQFFLCPCDYNDLPDGEIKEIFRGNDRGVEDCGEAEGDEVSYVTGCVKKALERIYEYITRDEVKKERWYKQWVKWAEAHGSGEGMEARKAWFTSVEQTAAAEGAYHRSEITPSDYYFEYAVVDKDGYDATAEALKDPKTKEQKRGIEFFLEMDYDSGVPYYRICMVVKDWNNACIRNDELSNYARRVRKEPDPQEMRSFMQSIAQSYRGSAYPLTQYPLFQVYWNTDENGNSIRPGGKGDEEGTASHIYDQRKYADLGGKIYLSGEDKDDRGAYGKIVFGFPDGKDGVTEEEVFRFAVNFAPKYVIRYRVKKRGKRKICVRLLDRSPASETPPIVQLCNLASAGTGNRIGSPVRLAKKMVFHVTVSENAIYRLHIEGGGGQLYILRNVERFTLKERDRMFKSGRLLTCPYCAGILVDPKRHRIQFLKGNLCCDGTQNENVTTEKKKDHARQIYCAQAGKWLPAGYERSNGLSLVFAGATESGKSSLISSSFAVMRGQRGKNLTFTIKLGTGDSADDYVALLDANNEAMPPCGDNVVVFGLDAGNANVGRSLLHNAMQPLGNIFHYDIPEARNVYFMYTKDLYREFVKSTDSEESLIKALRVSPVVMRLEMQTGNGYFSCFDAPGSSFSKDDAHTAGIFKGDLRGTAAEFATSVVLIVDQDKAGAVKSVVDAVMEARTEALRNLTNGPTKGPQEKMLREFNIAVVLNKCDMLWDRFDEGGYVRSTPPGFNDHYYGSSEKTYVDRCSEEVEHFLKSISVDVRAALGKWDGNVKDEKEYAMDGMGHETESEASQKKTKKDFQIHFKFFAVSSIGHPNSVLVDGEEGQDDKKPRSKTVFITRPRGLEHVYAWLAYQSGLIR